MDAIAHLRRTLSHDSRAGECREDARVSGALRAWGGGRRGSLFPIPGEMRGGEDGEPRNQNRETRLNVWSWEFCVVGCDTALRRAVNNLLSMRRVWRWVIADTPQLPTPNVQPRSYPALCRRIIRLVTFVALFSPIAPRPSPIAAQLSPNANWRTIDTKHFYVHFTPELEPLARRIAGAAERAYEQLSKELHPPRGKIDVVLSDDVDFSNGSATPYPTNRIVIYANPPVSESALRYNNDWGQLVITHELTHIFHLDRARGIWGLGQYVFGRAPLLFPNFYSPLWLTEGLAVYFESRLAGAGRIEGSEHRMIARSAAADHAFPALGSVSAAAGRFPFGETAYAYGSLFIDYVAKSRGEDK